MEPKDWIAIVSVSATVLISVVTIISNWRREKHQQEREDKLRREHQEREDKLRREQQRREERLRETERVHEPHIEISVDCNFYGPEGDEYLLEVLLTVQNKGLVEQVFRNIQVRIRGIEADKPLSYWRGRKPRLEFPIELVDDVQIIPERYSGYYVERGIEVVFPFVTKIPTLIKYILVHSLFEYENSTIHTTERVFQVKVNEDD